MTKISDESLIKTLNIVFGSERSMAANFTNNGDRLKSFCVDYENLSADDEYEMASRAWFDWSDFALKIPKKDRPDEIETPCLIKIGEDLMLGAYVLEKTDHFASFGKLSEELVKENVARWKKTIPSLAMLVKIELVQNWFDYCLWFGRARANGFGFGETGNNQI